MTRGLISEDEASEELCLDFGQSESGTMLAALESDRSRSRDDLEHVKRQLQQVKGNNVKVNYETFELAAFCLGCFEVRERDIQTAREISILPSIFARTPRLDDLE